ncbi:MAG TPA: glycosyltransferase, partial [Candidatus Paceibacterota bacterium]
MQSKQKKKILFVITKSNWGGAQRYVFDIALALKFEFDVAVVLGGDGPLKDKLVENGLRVISIEELSRDIKLKNEFKVLRNFIRLFKQERPDVVHLNSSKVGGLGGFAARIARVPKIIFTAHGWVFNENRPWYQKMIILFLHWLMVLFTHKTIAVSQKTADDMRRLPFMSKKIICIYNGINKETYMRKNIAREALISIHPSRSIILKNKKNIWIGSVSELHKNKGIDVAIHAIGMFVKEWPNTLYLVISDGEEKKNLEALMAREKLMDHVILLGFIENPSRFLKAFDIFL